MKRILPHAPSWDGHQQRLFRSFYRSILSSRFERWKFVEKFQLRLASRLYGVHSVLVKGAR